MSASPLPLSVVIITFNEARNLPRCLAALDGLGAADVLVLDSGSTDDTRAIAAAWGARVEVQPFLGYVGQKNRATELALHDHVLQLDADEVLTEELRQEIRHTLSHWQHPAYALPRLTNYCGAWVRHGGWYPDWQTRLYDRRQGRWQGELLHEHYAVTDGTAPAARLRAELLHYSYESISAHVRQLDRFTTLGATQLRRRGKKAHWAQLLLKPWWKFVSGYFLRLGFLDGFAGLSIAVLSSVGVFLKYAKIRTDEPPA
jgi:glycosyltransferase involved in cell wall biosynthesis